MIPITLTPVLPHQVGVAAVLFDQYRQFYGQPADHGGALRFLEQRLSRGESTLILAWRAGDAAGFTQLYPGFSSIRMQPVQVLNDLFVSQEHRRSGVALALLNAAENHARAAGAAFMTLSTDLNNQAARRLYEAAGWVRDPFAHYARELEG